VPERGASDVLLWLTIRERAHPLTPALLRLSVQEDPWVKHRHYPRLRTIAPPLNVTHKLAYAAIMAVFGLHLLSWAQLVILLILQVSQAQQAARLKRGRAPPQIP
jgi:hypothetical protein